MQKNTSLQAGSRFIGLEMQTDGTDCNSNLSLDFKIFKHVELSSDRFVINWQKFSPCVLIGTNQSLAHEVRIPYCDQNGISYHQRSTMGGAIYLDASQICFSITVEKNAFGNSLETRLRFAASIIQEVFQNLGIETNFKAPNDIETSARQKIASVFAREGERTVQIFFSIIAELDLKSAMQALLVPTEKLTVTGLEHAKERLTSVFEQCGRQVHAAEFKELVKAVIAKRFNLNFELLSDDFYSKPYQQADFWFAPKSTFETKDKVQGASMRLFWTVSNGICTNIKVITDAHFSPANWLAVLENRLENASINKVIPIIDEIAGENLFKGCGVEIDDFRSLFLRAIEKVHLRDSIGLNELQTSGLMLAGMSHDTDNALEHANVMLVPYCAKPNWCKWRHTIDCVECGMCEVGDAYTMARERNMDVITITNFEHLADTLEKMRESGVKSYVGMCCGEFFLKRHHAFRESGMDAVLMDIEGATCYELKEEHLAYQGAFKAEATLDKTVLEKIMSKVPVQPLANKPCLSGQEKRPHEIHAAKRQCENCTSQSKS